MRYLLDTSVYSQPLKRDPLPGVVGQGHTRPVIDLCIAATTLEHGCTLVTLNTKDFESIPNLRVEDSSI